MLPSFSFKPKFVIIAACSSFLLLISFVQLYTAGAGETLWSLNSHLSHFHKEPLPVPEKPSEPEKEAHRAHTGLASHSVASSSVVAPSASLTGHNRPSSRPVRPQQAPKAAGLSSSFPTSISQPTPTPPTGAIVVVVNSKVDLSWVNELKNDMWTLHRYNHDDPHPPANLSFPVNKGNEGMMYLSYIINNYDNLPDYTIFIHGHRQSWHQEGDMVSIINGLRLPSLDKAGYVPLRCDWYPSCPREIRPLDGDAVVWGPGVHRKDAEIEIKNAWVSLFGREEEMPRTIASQCCAQFAVTREAILGRKKEEYERMRDWLISTPLINDISGRVLEKLWAYIMTGDPIRCPPPGQCACEYFGQCQPKKWPIPPEGLEKWPETPVAMPTLRRPEEHQMDSKEYP